MANIVSIVEIDEKLVKALKIMNNGYPNAAEQLKAMLDEAIKEKYGNSRKPVSVLNKLNSVIVKKPSSSSLSGVTDDISNIKKPKLSSSDSKGSKHSLPKHVSSPSSSPSPPSGVINLEEEGENKSEASSDSRESTGGLEIVDEFNVCFVCKNRRGSGSAIGNKLIECAECHCSYHQECHTPPISDSDAADPRLIWYCVSCMRTMNKKHSSAPTSKSGSKSSSSSSSKSSSSLYSSGSSGTNKYSGSTSGSKSSSSSSKPSGTGGATTSSSLISADKRIQIMKKRAASKKPEPSKSKSKK